jgi:adenylate kinase
MSKPTELSHQIRAIVSKGGLVSNDIVLSLLRNAIKSSEGNKFLIDGYPRELHQAFAFEQQIGPSAFILSFEVPDDVMVERCVARGATSGRSDDNLDAAKNRVALFHSTSLPVIEFYTKVAKVRRVDANKSVDEVFEQVKKIFQPEIIFAPGGPGSGTSTVCKRISEEFGYSHISVGDVLRDEVRKGSNDGVLIGKLQKEGRLIPAALTQKLLKKTITESASTKFILDGFPKTFKQATLFEEEVGPCKFLLSLEAPISVMMERCLRRSRDDDHEDAVRQRLSVFKVQTEPLIESYKASHMCRSVDSSGNTEDVYNAVRKLFQPEVVFVLGGPGSGKGTQCERIRDTFGYVHISAGDLLRCELARGSPDGVMIDSMIRAGQIVPVEVTLALLKTAMRSSGSNKFLVDGFPRAIDQAVSYEANIGKCNMVLYIDVADHILENRLIARGQTSGRSDDNAESIKKRLKVYHSQSMPVIDHYARFGLVKRIDGGIGSPNDVFSRVSSLFTKKVVFVLGGPGAGKGTICSKIVSTYGYTHLSTGDLLRAEVARQSKLGQYVNDLMVEGQIVPQEIMMKLLIDAMNNSGGNRFLLDGFPRSMEQAQQYEAIMGKPSAVLYLELPESVMKERLLSRGATSGRADDNEATILKRFESFKQISFPVVDYYKDTGLLKRISAIPSPNIVFDEARSLFAPKFVLVNGSAGSGRGTLAKFMGKNHGYSRIRVTEILDAEAAKDTADGEIIRSAIREKRTVPVKYTISAIKNAILAANNDKFIIDGYPRVVSDGYPLVHDQVAAFESSIGHISLMVNLEASKESRAARSSDAKAAEESHEIYLREKLAAVRYFETVNKCFHINADQAPEKVYADVMAAVSSV